jgi:NAD(P)H dehydrogenase (quinone)
VTGASGPFGQHVLDALLDRGVAPEDIRAGARRTDALAAYADRGVDVVHLDYDDPESVARAVKGADRVLLVSGSEFGKRVAQHGAVVDAARDAGVQQFVYTSAAKAHDTTLAVAPEHKETEELIREAGLPYTILRNNWYTENYAQDLATAREAGVLASSAGEGRVASATRADYAEAAAVVLTEDGHVGQVYELAGDEPWTFQELAEAFGEVLGRDVELRELTTDEHVALLETVGLDAGTAGFVAALSGNIRDGELGDSDGTLRRLLGRPTTPLVEGLRRIA